MAAPSPGWYQDPEGPPGQARYWDGRSWAKGAGVPAEQGAAPTVAPGRSRPPWLWPVVAVVAVALVLGLGWALSGLLTTTPGTDPTPAEPTLAESREPTGANSVDPAPTGVGELDCAAARSDNYPKGPELRVAGIVVPFPDETWGFRYDSSQWTWINDLHAWGTVDIEPRDEGWAAGIVAGRLQAVNGFGAPEQAAQAVAACLVSHGAFNTGMEMEVVSSEALVVDGMDGWHLRLAYREGGVHDATEIDVVTLDAAQAGNLATVIGFHPRGHEATGAEVLRAIEGITRQ